MTEIEKQTFGDGFRVGMLVADCDARDNRYEFWATLYNGGREVQNEHRRDFRLMPSTGFFAALRSFLLRLLAPPHVLVAAGRGWKELIEHALPRQVTAEPRDRIRSFEYHLVGSELEALLLGHRLIRNLSPDVNLQRHVAGGRSRYGFFPGTVAVLKPSAQEGSAELFFLGIDRDCAVQLRVDPRRLPLRVLADQHPEPGEFRLPIR